MKIEELIAELERIKSECEFDPEESHLRADSALLRFIADERVSKLHDELAVWFS